MEPEHFYWVGGALTLAAIVVSVVGLRDDGFPSSRGALLGTLALFLFGVVATTAYAVVNARDEQDHRRAELAKAEEEAGAEEHEAQETGAEGSEIASPADEEKAAQAGGEAPAQAGGEKAAQDGEEEGAGGGGPVPVAMLEYEFDPSEVTVEQGTKVSADNDGEVVHNLTVLDGTKELGGTGNIESGDSGDLEVNFAPGDYEMICTIPGHEELGMTGTFRVE